jgi:NADPH-dependent ferric siderophore reductase
MAENGHGGRRQGSGRNPKADEIKIIEQMDAVAVPEDAWRALWVKCQEGDTQAIKTWLNYRFGMPKQKIDHTTDGERITPPIEWISSKK